MKRIRLLPRLPPRRQPAHKGQFGHVLIVGGAVGMSGAVALAGRAAARAGAGLVTLACPAHNHPIVATLVPEALTVPLPQRPDGRIDPSPAGETLLARAAAWTVLAAGCGWGTDDEPFARDSLAMIRKLAGHIGGPAVLDADGLNLLAIASKQASWPVRGPESASPPLPGPGTVLTPHPGEMARLLDSSTKDVQADRLGAASAAVAKFSGAVVVLKGAGTIVTDGQRYYVNTTGNAGLATGGTGDVLTGLIAALLGQQLEPFDAAVLGVYLHGLAGDLAARKRGMVSLIAPDLPDYLGPAFLKLARNKR